MTSLPAQQDAVGFYLLHRIVDHAHVRPQAEAFREAGADSTGRTISYSELATKVRELAATIRIEAPGGTLLVSCSNRLEFPIAYLAVLAAGCTVVPVHPRLTAPELASLADSVSATGVLGAHGRVPTLPGLTRISVDSARPPNVLHHGGHRPASAPGPTLLLQSSGTTGAPRIAIRPGRSLDSVAEVGAIVQRLTPDDRVLACIPLSHSYGMENALLSPLWAGCAVTLLDGFDGPAAVRELRAGATVFPGVPFMFEALSILLGDRSARADTLRLSFSAGSAMPASVAARFRQVAGIGVGQLYGATELGLVTFGDPTATDFDPATVGKPAPGVQVAILDPENLTRRLPQGHEGQVAVAAPSMLSGYLHDPLPAVGGYFLTGDLGRFDGPGRLTITGRLKLLIDVGGLKVNPGEVERAILEHPDVGECAVVPLQLSDTVKRILAVVSPRQGLSSEALKLDELRRFAQDRLAPYKVPRIFQVRTSLPKSASGKILRRELENS